jgi:hypothetical protein
VAISEHAMLNIDTPPHTTTEQNLFIMWISSGKHRAFVQEVNPDARLGDRDHVAVAR